MREEGTKLDQSCMQARECHMLTLLSWVLKWDEIIRSACNGMKAVSPVNRVKVEQADHFDLCPPIHM